MVAIGKQNLIKEYFEHISRHSKITDEDLRTAFLEILDCKDPLQRVEKWKKLKVSIPSFKQLIYLANPFFIGYGNPESKILFLGKEKAFNMKEEPELFIHESVNNLLQWERIQSEGKPDHQKLYEELGFNPMFPSLHFGKFKKRHTWGLYSEIVRELRGLTGEILNTREYNQSFFRHCFLSEINYIPARYSEGHKLDPIRKTFLKTNFFKRFPIVIIGATGYLTTKDIQDIFGSGEVVTIELGENKSRRISATVITTPNQKILLCNQLSGAAGWTTEALKNLVLTCSNTVEIT